MRRLLSLTRVAACWAAMIFGADPLEAAPVITELTAAQRAGTKLVDIAYNVAATGFSRVAVRLQVSSDGGATWSVPAVNVTGDVGPQVAVGTNKSIVWDAGKDWPRNHSTQMQFRLTADDGYSFIPAGSFTMGRTSGDTDSDAPPVSVMVSGFYIQKTETTKAQWDEVRAWGLDNGYTDLAAGEGKAADHPVHSVSWWDVVKWCNARSEREGLTPVYTVGGAVMRTGTVAPVANWSADGYRLPTEAEWEKAARGGVSGRRFPWGTDTISHEQANYFGSEANYGNQSSGYHPIFMTGATPYTSPVASFSANEYGQYDICGNVWEWCWDWYDPIYYTTSNGTMDPRGPTSGSNRVVRGGSWSGGVLSARCAYRNNTAPAGGTNRSGFRPARSTVSAPTASNQATIEGVRIDTRAFLSVTGDAGSPVLNGAIAPDSLNGTDFGSLSVLGEVGISRFTLTNTEAEPLLLDETTQWLVESNQSPDFTITEFPASSLTGGASSSFSIHYAPSSPGQHSGVVRIVSDQLYGGEFRFAVGGFGKLPVLVSQQIVFNPPTAIYLAESPLALHATASSGLPVVFRVISGPGIIQNGILNATDVGSIRIEATQLGGGNTAPARPVIRTIRVQSNPSSLALAGLRQVYDGDPKPVTVLNGLVGSTVVYLVNGFGTTAPPTDAGHYAVEVSTGNQTARGTLVIEPAVLRVRANDQTRWLGEANPQLTVSFDGWQGSDTMATALLTPVRARTTATVTSSPGAYPITVTGGSAANYRLIHEPGTMTVLGIAGRYEALLRDLNDGLPAGKVSLSLARSGRSFSGQLHLAGETQSLSLRGVPVLDRDLGVTTLSTLELRNGFALSLQAVISRLGEMRIEVRRDGALIASSDDGMRLLEVERARSAPHSGQYTGFLETITGAGPDTPRGMGWFSATGNRTGRLNLSGRLGDGTAFTSSVEADLLKLPGFRIFMQPYRPTRAHSWIGGVFSLEEMIGQPGRFSQSGSQLHWKKVGLQQDQAYRDGFGPVTTSMSLYPWLPPTRSVGLPALMDTQTGQWQVAHDDTGSPSGVVLATLVGLTPTNRLEVLAPVTSPPNLRRWQAVIQPRTGLFLGSFELQDPPQARTVPFSGVLRQTRAGEDDLIGAGHYLLPPLKSAASTERTSGAVLFSRPE